jgi:nicotinamide-nucleotide amidase
MDTSLLFKIHKALLMRRKTLSVAESCSGGMLCERLTANPGASGYFMLGVVVYSNASKQKVLRIPGRMIAGFGAVSRQVATAMAVNVRQIAKTDFGIGVTGIAGPKGDAGGKPVGTVFICVSSGKRNACRKFNFKGTRQEIRKKSVREALRLLCAHLSP